MIDILSLKCIFYWNHEKTLMSPVFLKKVKISWKVEKIMKKWRNVLSRGSLMGYFRIYFCIYDWLLRGYFLQFLWFERHFMKFHEKVKISINFMNFLDFPCFPWNLWFGPHFMKSLDMLWSWNYQNKRSGSHICTSAHPMRYKGWPYADSHMMGWGYIDISVKSAEKVKILMRPVWGIY